ncbi:unnamed protein product, partial [Plutella xylostella]
IRGNIRGIREACRQYGVPRATIQDRLSGRVADQRKSLAIHDVVCSLRSPLNLWYLEYGIQSVSPGSAAPEQPERQRDWDEEQCRLQLDMLMLGTLLDNDSLRVAVALRLGCTVVEPHVCVYGARVDQSGRHGLHCVRSAGRFSRHHAINDIVRRALVSADVPAVLEPPGLSRTDGKRPDGLTMVPWEKGRSLLWDATCVCTLALSHVQSTAANAGATAEAAARLKKLKYSQLKQRYLFVPLAVETMGVWGEEGRAFLREIGRRLRIRGLGSSSGAHLMQRGLGGVTFPKWNLFGNTKSRNQELKKPDRRFWPPQQKESRFLSLFTVVTFPNGGCAGASGDNGTCMTARECSARGGSANGYCANGFGLCCIFMTSCGSTTSENGTYFVNAGYPSGHDGSGSCELTIVKNHPDVCQIRLDFDRFTIAGPEQINHICNQDQFIVSGGNPIPTICGVNQGMYIDAGIGTTNPVKLTFVTSGTSFERMWKVKVTQIPCSTIYRGLQLSNQDYGICIRTERNFCGIQYSACPDTVNNRSKAFTLSGNSNNPVNSMIGSGPGPNNCANDWLLIPCAANFGRLPPAQALCTDRICGGTFSADLSMQASAVIMPVHFWRLAVRSAYSPLFFA